MTSGLGTLAVRIPSNKIALELLKTCDVPIAAPSANRSGKISTTNASDVIKELNGIIPAVIDGGISEIGLESTIIDVSTSSPVLLRPGGKIIEDIEQIIGNLEIKSRSSFINSPGQLTSHYSPGHEDEDLMLKVKIRVEVLLGFGSEEADISLSKSGNLTEAATNLFSHMRSIDILAKHVGGEVVLQFLLFRLLVWD